MDSQTGLFTFPLLYVALHDAGGVVAYLNTF